MATNKALTDKEIEMIREFAECDMCVSNTAISLGYHYTSLQYHLNKIAKKTKLDPHCFYELIKLLRMTGEEV